MATATPLPLEAPQTADDALALIEPRAATWPELARSIVIDSDAAFAAAGEKLKGIKALRKEIADTFGPIVRSAHEAHKKAKDAEKKADAPLVEAESILKRSMADYHDRRQREIEAETRRLEAEARRREEEQRLAEAVALEAAGEAEAAEATLDAEPPLVAVAPPPPPPPKAAGVAMRETWSAEVVDVLALVKAVAAGEQPLSLILPNEKALDAMARALKADLAIPGVRAKRTLGVAAGTRS